jgi:hypothetical protein
MIGIIKDFFDHCKDSAVNGAIFLGSKLRERLSVTVLRKTIQDTIELERKTDINT